MQPSQARIVRVPLYLPNTLKVTVFGENGHEQHFLQYDVHQYSEMHYKVLQHRILRYTGQHDFDREMRLFWITAEFNCIDIIGGYGGLKRYLDACVAANKPCQIYACRRSKTEIFWRSVDRVVQRYGRVYFKWI